jgi:hypothetical protein
MSETMQPSGASAVGGDEMYVVDSPYEVANWRPLVHWLMYIPHHIIVYVLYLLAGVVFIIYWVALLITGQLHKGMYGILAMLVRYAARAQSFLYGFTEIYAPFDFDTGTADNGVYPPVRVNLPEPPESTSRVAALNWILAIPHYIVLWVFAIGAFFVLIIGWFAVLFTGRWPDGMRDFLVQFGNYYMRVWAYVAMVDTDYPRFGI